MRHALLALTVLAALASAPAQGSERTEMFRFAVAGGSVVNPCTGETVTFTQGSFQIVAREGEDSSGGLHVITEANAQGIEGVSDTGTPYRVSGGFWAELNDNGANAQQVFTVTDVLNLTSRGSGDNLAVQTAFHLTLDADGDVTSLHFEQADGPCRG